MSEIDLVPSDYRLINWLRTQATTTVTVIAASLLLTIVSYTALNVLSGRLDGRISALQSQQAITAQQRDVLTQLDAQKVTLDRKLNLLTGLRGGTEAARVFVTIDRTLNADDVWFLNWRFRRAGAAVENKAETTRNGYFIVIPAEDGKESDEAWKIETHMTLKGQAQDHSALSGFVRRLYEQPEIEDVKILNTSKDPQGKFVTFDLVVTVNSGEVNG